MEIKAGKKSGTFIRTIMAVLFLLYSVCPFPLQARQEAEKFRRLLSEDGLSHNNIYSIIQDSRGFMWFGTQDGLNRYDGGEFVTFYHDPQDPESLGSSNFGKLLEDSKGTLWLGTWGGGLDRYDPKTGTFIHHQHDPENPDSIAENQISCLFKDNNGNLWIGTSRSGFDRFDRETGKFIHHRHDPDNPNSPADNRIRVICGDRWGVLWIGTYGGGVDKFNPESGEFTHFKSNPDNPETISNNSVRTLYFDREGHLWVGTHGGGLNKIDTQSGKATRYNHNPNDPNSLGSQTINHIFQDSKGFLWIGHYDVGLDRFDPKSGKFEHFLHRDRDSFSLSHDRIEAILEDRSGMLWVGTRGGGLSILDLKPPRFKTLDYKRLNPSPAELTSRNALSIYEDRAGTLWVGTDGAGIDKRVISRETGEAAFINYRPDPRVFGGLLSHSRVWALLEDRYGTFWVGTYTGLKIMDRSTGTFFPVKVNMPPGEANDLEKKIVVSLSEDRRGTLWAGTTDGLYRLKAGDRNDKSYNARHYFTSKNSSFGGSRNYISDIYEDSNGKLWIASDYGLCLMEEQGETVTFKSFLHDSATPRSISHNMTIVIHEDRAGRFWVGTVGGLNRLDRETGEFFQYYKKEGGLPNNVIRGILEDDDGNLWISTSNGLSRFNPEKGSFRNFDTYDGLLSNDFNSRVYSRSRTGEMFFSGSRGVISFLPGKLMDNPNIPPIVLTSFKIRGREKAFQSELAEHRPVQLSFKENSFSFEFVALDYTDPGKNSYKYRLDNFDRGWKENRHRRFVSYTNIPPGDYTFRVIGSNNDGIWNRVGVTLDIKIIPPFWSRTWFRLFVLVFVIGLIYLFYRLRVRSINRRQARMRELVRERTLQLNLAKEEAHREREAAEAANRSKSDFLARMSHEIRTPLNSIIGFNEILLETKLDEQQADYIKTVKRSGELLLELINEILDFSRIEAGQSVLEDSDFNPSAIAFDVCHITSPRVESRSIEVLCSIHDGVPAYVRGDAGKFRQVLMNLMGNAVKFTDKGEIELHMQTGDEDDRRVQLRVGVRDTGIGIPEQQQETIFNEFQQGDGSTTRKYGGSGLGLAISKKIAGLMEGDLRVENNSDVGSTFYFDAWLNKSGKTDEPKNYRSLANKKALLIEDHQKSLEILSGVLTRHGMRVIHRAEGNETISLLTQAAENGDPFDVCLLDTGIPQLDSKELARRVPHSPNPLSTIPLLALSPSGEKKTGQFMESGFDTLLIKPVQEEKLLEIMDRLLNGRAGKRLPKEIVAGEPVPVSPGASGPRPREDHSSPCVLIAEDNAINQKLIRHILKKAGYRMDMVDNGKKVVRSYIKDPGKYHLILMDIQMPEMNGIEATEEIRNWEKENSSRLHSLSGIPIIALTAQAIKGDREKCMEAGMNDFISKPIKRDLVLERIHHWLSTGRSDTG
ncbi:MAG: response regulator [bacterium]|nr:response regulator [bacterium]